MERQRLSACSLPGTSSESRARRRTGPLGLTGPGAGSRRHESSRRRPRQQRCPGLRRSAAGLRPPPGPAGSAPDHRRRPLRYRRSHPGPVRPGTEVLRGTAPKAERAGAPALPHRAGNPQEAAETLQTAVEIIDAAAKLMPNLGFFCSASRQWLQWRLMSMPTCCATAEDLVRAHRESGWTARLVPLTVDGLIYASSMATLDSARRQGAGARAGAVAPRLGYRCHTRGSGPNC